MQITTQRLRLRQPLKSDAQTIFDQYACDPAVTRYLSWPTHTRLDDTLAFIEFSDTEWAGSGTGPLLVETLSDNTLIGSTGLSMETSYRANTGYAFAQFAWGHGYASEALAAMIELADEMGVYRLEAITHVQHVASAHVLLKGGFQQEGLLRGHTRFPNLDDSTPQDIFIFGRTANNAV